MRNLPKTMLDQSRHGLVLTKTPSKVIIVTFLVSVPMFVGFQQLEVGFDQRDNFDDSVPVVKDFLTLSDEFQSSPAPLYAVLDGNVISKMVDCCMNSCVKSTKMKTSQMCL